MEILYLGNDILRQKAQPIKKIGSEYMQIAQELLRVLQNEKGVGLAGPQVGLMERIFVVHISGDEPRVFINPSVTETSEETLKYEEGCLSIPNLYADVIRPAAIKVQAWNESGRSFTIEASGLLARVILHEMDHLEGKLFIDRISEFKRSKIIEKFEKACAGKDKAELKRTLGKRSSKKRSLSKATQTESQQSLEEES